MPFLDESLYLPLNNLKFFWQIHIMPLAAKPD